MELDKNWGLDMLIAWKVMWCEFVKISGLLNIPKVTKRGCWIINASKWVYWSIL